jgi:hypothetical protein
MSRRIELIGPVILELTNESLRLVLWLRLAPDECILSVCQG